MDLSYPNLLTLAGIHATIISIFMAAAIGYFLYLVSRRDELLSAIYDEAQRVNSISFGMSYDLPGRGIYVASDRANRRELLNRLTSIAMGVPHPDLPSDRKARGEEALRIMSALGNYYPFPQGPEPTPEGGLIIGEPTRVEFKEVDEIKKWVSEADYLSSQLIWLLTAHRSKFLGVVYEAADELYKDLEERLDPGRIENFLDREALEDLRRMTRQPQPFRRIVDRFVRNVENLRQIAQSVNDKLVRWEIYERRTTNRGVMLGLLSMNLIAFLAGVVYPITGTQIGLKAIIWVPFIIYGVAFLYVIKQAIAPP